MNGDHILCTLIYVFRDLTSQTSTYTTDPDPAKAAVRHPGVRTIWFPPLTFVLSLAFLPLASPMADAVELPPSVQIVFGVQRAQLLSRGIVFASRSDRMQSVPLSKMIPKKCVMQDSCVKSQIKKDLHFHHQFHGVGCYPWRFKRPWMARATPFCDSWQKQVPY